MERRKQSVQDTQLRKRAAWIAQDLNLDEELQESSEESFINKRARATETEGFFSLHIQFFKNMAQQKGIAQH